jgi:hypothetical protein
MCNPTFLAQRQMNSPLEELGLAEVEHDARNNRVRARS